MSTTDKAFIIIDDDPINNLICHKIISLTLKEADIHTFTNPEVALSHIEESYSNPSAQEALLFLDINMPSMTGWEVLEKIEHCSKMVQTKVKIYMLSSSVDTNDQERAKEHPLISGYITKPLTQNKFLAVYH